MGDLAKLRSIKESPEIKNTKLVNLLIVSVQTVLMETRQKAVINEVRQ